ncbi:NnrS family protein [Aliiroseovarius sp. PTFE2010]|uniref:NnrS family protein n=1 Tax=Aliiroseovarius sp. PTFE2010 TaxID=3417190 RepID=UPI003CE9F087
MPKSTATQMRDWQGPAVLSFGFRPFFLGGAAWVVLAMVLWLFMLGGKLVLPTRLDAVSWHAHEFLFGYLGAVLAGFLLTAVPNWTGRLPVVGVSLGWLFSLWVAGRVAMMGSALAPAWLPILVDLAFPVALGGVIAREIVTGKNWRNLIVLGLLVLFTVANLIFHIEAAGYSAPAQGYGLRMGLATAVLMISVIGGRIIPSFTRNWLVQQRSTSRPAPPMRRFDKGTIAVTCAILFVWVLQPENRTTAALLAVMAGLHALRLARWQGHRTLSEPLVWVLHLSYALIPLGALMMAYAGLTGTAAMGPAQHIWMAGAIGAMTLAVMTRATLGHTGHTLRANRATVGIYLALFGSVVARWLAGDFPVMTYVAGPLWILAFGGFVAAYGPLLVRPRRKAHA